MIDEARGRASGGGGRGVRSGERDRNLGGEVTDYATATLDVVRRAGVAALARELGPVGMVRFLQQFETGSGDYTAERQRDYGAGTPGAVTALAEEIMREQQAGRLGPLASEHVEPR